MSIKFKLYLNVFIAASCLLCVGATGYYYVNKVAHVSESLLEDQALPVIKINEIEKLSQAIFTKIILHCGTSDIKEFGKIEEDINALNAALSQKILDASRQQGQSSRLSAALDAFQKKWAEFNAIKEEVLNLSKGFLKKRP